MNKFNRARQSTNPKIGLIPGGSRALNSRGDDLRGREREGERQVDGRRWGFLLHQAILSVADEPAEASLQSSDGQD